MQKEDRLPQQSSLNSNGIRAEPTCVDCLGYAMNSNGRDGGHQVPADSRGGELDVNVTAVQDVGLPITAQGGTTYHRHHNGHRAQRGRHVRRFQQKEHEGPINRRCGLHTSSLFQCRTGALMALVLVMVYCSSATAEASEEVADLGGDSDFNKVRLHWRYPRMDSDFGGFKVTHCEDQAWGPHRCRNIVLRPNELTQTPIEGELVEYSGLVPHLRMATNYTMRVTPLTGDAEALRAEDSSDIADEGRRTSSARGRAIPDGRGTAQVVIQTKGFSARAISCLTNSTQVEVETGPYFGGKISVEGSLDAACATHGDAKNPTTKYRLDISHALCGSKLLNDSVRTYILVQENLPILTHSTRRFMVVCHYIPEAFTVSAGVSLPEEAGPASLVPVDQSINEVDPSELFDFTNDLFSSRLTSRTGKSLKLQQEDEDPGPRMWTQLVLMVILVVAAVVGLSCAFWHFGKHAGLAARLRGEPLPSGSSELEAVSSDAGSVAEEQDLDQEEQPEDPTLRQSGQHHQPREQVPSPVPTSSSEGSHGQQSSVSQTSSVTITPNKFVDSTSNLNVGAVTNVTSVSVPDSCSSDSSATNTSKSATRLTGDNIFVHDLLDMRSEAVGPAVKTPEGQEEREIQSAAGASANTPAGAGWEQFDEDKVPIFDCDALSYSTVEL